MGRDDPPKVEHQKKSSSERPRKFSGKKGLITRNQFGQGSNYGPRTARVFRRVMFAATSRGNTPEEWKLIAERQTREALERKNEARGQQISVEGLIQATGTGS